MRRRRRGGIVIIAILVLFVGMRRFESVEFFLVVEFSFSLDEALFLFLFFLLLLFLQLSEFHSRGAMISRTRTALTRTKEDDVGLAFRIARGDQSGVVIAHDDII